MTDLQTVTLSEVRQRQIPYDTAYIRTLKNDANELLYETELDSQI